uniref:Uncharacterized protein n=1 Tax=Arundo donax TaxID=35708 RepID=A0A0A9HC45_ARUDO
MTASWYPAKQEAAVTMGIKDEGTIGFVLSNGSKTHEAGQNIC